MEDKGRKILAMGINAVISEIDINERLTILALAYEDLAKLLIDAALNCHGTERCQRYLAAFNTHLDGTKKNIANYAQKRIDEEI